MISAQELYFEQPLYNFIEYDEADFKDIFDLMFYSGKIDNYCPNCEKESILKGVPEYWKAKDLSSRYYTDTLSSFERFSEEKKISDFNDKLFVVKFQCERHPLHKFEFYVKFVTINYIKNGFYKTGQFPAIADLKDYKTKKYKKILKDQAFSELNKAIGLASHGIGIGSFVYLRRIFEDLIWDTYNSHKQTIDDDLGKDKLFKSLKMDDKIKTLKAFLPKFLFDNKDLYITMSQGIHQLKEKECLELYPRVELGIRLILEDKLNEYEKLKMLEEYKKK
jgi:hypothetical protein